MYLVDTSVWIDLFRQNGNPQASRLKALLASEVPLSISSMIYQEILQGARDEKDFSLLRDYFADFAFSHPRDEIASHAAAAQIYFDCRRKGITIRSSIDCLIAQTAIEHGLILLHNDRDFERIAQVAVELKLES